jgi:glyoxylase-like metal-dependent hydrolase (beta-lactamase superfamily II)
MRQIALLLLTLWGSAALAIGYAPVKIVLEAKKVSEHIYYVQGKAGAATAENEGFNSNAGFVVTPDGVIVVDSLGTPSLGAELIKVIRKTTDKPIKRVLVTHYHADHIYGLQAFQEAGAEIWAHQEARAYLDGEESKSRLQQRKEALSPWVNDDTRLVTPARWLDRDESFTFGGLHFDILHLGPAHSPEDIVIFVREDHILFSGDILFSGRVPFVGDADSRRWLQVMSRLLELKPKIMVTGHGEASLQPEKDLGLTRDYLTYLRTTMGKAVADFISFDEAYAKTDWSRFSRLPAFEAANRVNAYGTYLLMEKESLQSK